MAGGEWSSSSAFGIDKKSDDGEVESEESGACVQLVKINGIDVNESDRDSGLLPEGVTLQEASAFGVDK